MFIMCVNGSATAKMKSEPTEKGPYSALRCLWLRFNFLWVYDKVL